MLKKMALLPLSKYLLQRARGTSDLAARALGCTVAEIAKTIGFLQKERIDATVLVVLSGDKRVSPRKAGSRSRRPP